MMYKKTVNNDSFPFISMSINHSTEMSTLEMSMLAPNDILKSHKDIKDYILSELLLELYNINLKELKNLHPEEFI